MKILKKYAALVFVIALLAMSISGCGSVRQTEVNRLIGVSLANLTDEWRIVLKNELEDEAKRYPGLKLIFTDAGGDVRKQKKDMRELMEYGAELLIVSPVDVEELMPEVEEIYHEDMPILLLDRAIKGFDYTCFFGADDRLLVKQELEAVTALTEDITGKGTGADGPGGNKVTVLNILMDNYTGRQRSGLLKEAADGDLEIRQLMIEKGTRDETEDILMERQELLDEVDLILTQNDYMAYGASLALEKLGQRDIKILGVDGFSGVGGGLDMVKRGLIDATIICPTGAVQALSYAIRYLEGDKDGSKQIINRNTLVTKENVDDYYPDKKKAIKKDIRSVGYVQIDENTGFRRANTNSFSDAATEYDIELEIKECATIDEQLSAFDDFVEMGKDAIIVSPLVEDGWEEAFSKAKERGIPVILSDREVSCSEELYTSFVGSDFVEEGARCMRWIQENMEDKDNVRILEIEGTKGASPAIDRGNGFRSLMQEDGSTKIIGTINGNFSKEEGYTAMSAYLSENGADFDVVFSHNDDMMLGAVEALKEFGIVPGEDVKLLSIDGTKEALTGIREGEVNFVAECTPLLGPNVMRTLSQLGQGEEVPLRVISSEETFDSETPDTVYRMRKY